jgi:hypothetical protein
VTLLSMFFGVYIMCTEYGACDDRYVSHQGLVITQQIEETL